MEFSNDELTQIAGACAIAASMLKRQGNLEGSNHFYALMEKINGVRADKERTEENETKRSVV